MTRQHMPPVVVAADRAALAHTALTLRAVAGYRMEACRGRPERLTPKHRTAARDALAAAQHIESYLERTKGA